MKRGMRVFVTNSGNRKMKFLPNSSGHVTKDSLHPSKLNPLWKEIVISYQCSFLMSDFFNLCLRPTPYTPSTPPFLKIILDKYPLGFNRDEMYYQCPRFSTKEIERMFEIYI